MPPNQLNLGSLQMPITAATKTFAILAKRGAGKSYTGAVLAEEFAANEIPFVVFDPIDVWWGLRLAADGVSAGLPVVVFGIDHADVPLTADMGVEIARAVIERNVSVVISTFGMSKTAQRKLITDFSEELLRINNRPRHIIVEEAHEFVPQRVMGDMARCFNAVNSLVVMGRNRGLGATLISQRAATINKDTLTQIDTLLAFRNVAPQDRKALREWVEYHAAEGDFAAFMDSLPNLPTGEGWVWSPEFLETFERVKIRPRTTFHPDREKLGASFAIPPLAQVDVQEFISQFRAVESPATVESKPKARKAKPSSVAKPMAESLPRLDISPFMAKLEEVREEMNRVEEQWRQRISDMGSKGEHIESLKAEIVRLIDHNGELKQEVEHWKAIANGKPVAPTSITPAPAQPVATAPTSAPHEARLAQRMRQEAEQQKRRFDALITDMRALPASQRDLLIFLIQREGTAYALKEIAKAIHLKEMTLRDHPPISLLDMGMLERRGERGSYRYYFSGRETLKKMFPDFTTEDLIKQVIQRVR